MDITVRVPPGRTVRIIVSRSTTRPEDEFMDDDAFAALFGDVKEQLSRLTVRSGE